MRFTKVQSSPTVEGSAGILEGGGASDVSYQVAPEEARWSTVFSWSSSPTLQKICQCLEKQQRVVDQLKRYLEERLAPFQRHVGEHRRHIDQALKHMESRLVPLRQYIQGKTQTLDRVRDHLDSGLRDQFEAFEQFLASQKGLLEQVDHYIAEQPRPLQTYMEDERQAVEMIYRDLEQRLDRFLQNLSAQQQILDFLRHPEVRAEYEALARYLEGRQKALERYSRSSEYRPAELFAQLDEAADHYKRLQLDYSKLSDKVFGETRLADKKLREALPVPRTSLAKEPEGDVRPAYPQDNPREAPESDGQDCLDPLSSGWQRGAPYPLPHYEPARGLPAHTDSLGAVRRR